jgi:hypothetical protein
VTDVRPEDPGRIVQYGADELCCYDLGEGEPLGLLGAPPLVTTRGTSDRRQIPGGLQPAPSGGREAWKLRAPKPIHSGCTQSG